jgi:hypothetical protein
MSPVESQSRHYAAPPLPKSFKCPACGAENTGRLEDGCTACGSGKPGQHVGEQPLQVRQPPAETPDRDSVGQAFIRWKKEQQLPAHWAADVLEILFRAFHAGYVFGVGQTAQTAMALNGTAESRTVAAALRLFLDQVLPIAKDEIESGEYLSIEDTRKLIERIERAS